MKRSIELLPQVSFSILVALSLRPRHGYEIMQQVEADSLSRIKLGPGTLYTTIQKLVDEGLIEEIEPTEATRRRYYQLTPAGWQRLQAESEYYTNVAQLSQLRLNHNGGQA